MRILVVADEMGEIIERCLRHYGHFTTRLTTRSVDELLEVVRNGDFDALILTNNCCIPIPEIGRAMERAREERPTMRRVVLSGYVDRKLSRDWESAGADLLMSMPFRRDAFLGNLELVLGRPPRGMTVDLGN